MIWVDTYLFGLSLTCLSATLLSGLDSFVILFIMITNLNDKSRHYRDILRLNLSNPQPYASPHQHVETLLTELHDMYLSNIYLIRLHQEKVQSLMGLMMWLKIL